MATPPNEDEQPRKRGRKKAVPHRAPAEPFLTDSEAEAAGPIGEWLEDVIREGRKSRSQPRTEPREDREDVKRNRNRIRAVMVSYIKNECRVPTTQEICEATGLSDKTVKAHKKHIKLGDGSSNIYQQLTHDVIMSLYKKAKGFTYQSEKLLTVSQGSGLGSAVERHDLTMYVQPDTAAAKLWFQAIEGMSERSETKHSGEIKGGGGFTFNYVAPKEPAADGQ